MGYLEKENILIISTTFWNDLQFRRQIFARFFSNTNKVLYINPLFGILSFVRDPDIRSKYFGFLKGAQKITPMLSVLTFPPLLPFAQKYIIISKINRIISTIFLNIATRLYFGKEKFVEIVYLPEDSYWTPHKRSKYLIYDCVDEQSEYPSRKKNRDKINKLEIELLRKSDLIFVTGYELFKKKSIINVNTHFVSNGVDFDLFSHAQNTYTIEPEITELQGTIVLYIGAIFEWFDLDLVHYLAAERPHLNIVLIGPTNYDRLKLQKYKNILYIGKRKRELLPQYLKIAEVCIIPFVLNDLTHSVNPLKLYEYWAAGKPVVSVAMRELLPLKKDNILEIAETPQDFLAKLEKMIAANNESFEEIRRTIAKKYSWSLLFEKYSSIISQQLKSNNIL